MFERKSISFFLAPITNLSSCKRISVYDVWRYVISKYARNKCQVLEGCKDKKEFSEAKKNLDYITPAGLFSQRKWSNLISLSGYACFDFDGLECFPVFPIFENKRYFSFVSPSGKGLKVFIDIEDDFNTAGIDINQRFLNNISREDYDLRQKLYKEICYYYLNGINESLRTKCDTSCFDLTRACYLCFDNTCKF